MCWTSDGCKEKLELNVLNCFYIRKKHELLYCLKCLNYHKYSTKILRLSLEYFSLKVCHTRIHHLNNIESI